MKLTCNKTDIISNTNNWKQKRKREVEICVSHNVLKMDLPSHHWCWSLNGCLSLKIQQQYIAIEYHKPFLSKLNGTQTLLY